MADVVVDDAVRAVLDPAPVGVLSEESGLDQGAHAVVVIVDPVDGTREYAEERSDWAVHVALAIDGVPRVGAVALPGLGEVLRTLLAKEPGKRFAGAAELAGVLAEGERSAWWAAREQRAASARAAPSSALPQSA